jgi:hypothetical protein
MTKVACCRDMKNNQKSLHLLFGITFNRHLFNCWILSRRPRVHKRCRFVAVISDARKYDNMTIPGIRCHGSVLVNNAIILVHGNHNLLFEVVFDIPPATLKCCHEIALWLVLDKKILSRLVVT